MPDLSSVPLTALSSEAKHLISTLLNPPKVIPSSSGLLRDWRGLAQACSIGGETLPAIASDADPSNRIFTIVQKRSQDFTLESLKDALEKIERWDIVDDCQPLLEKDAELYLERLAKSQTTAEKNDFDADADILTLDDQFRIERGEEKQHYDGFLLYADEDEEFAKEVVEHLETKNNMKLCLKDRDLIAGISFEHEAIIRLISERCNRLIAIISPEFLKCPANKFFVNFAQANGMHKRQERKIIPCVYKNCELPPQLIYFSKIYYKKLSPDYFWDKLNCSMKAIQPVKNAQKSSFVPRIIKSSSTEKKNGLIQNIPAAQVKVQENSSGETSKSTEKSTEHTKTRVSTDKSPESTKTRVLFPWKRKQKTDPIQVPSQGEESTNQESIPSLPSLDGLDSLSTLTSSANTTTKQSKKKKKFMGSYMKKVQSLLAKS